MAKHVLIVDDEPDLRRALTVRLAAAGFHCETAANGRDGLTKAHHMPPDLIIVDLLMPQMNGSALCRELARDARTASIPVVVLSVLPVTRGGQSPCGARRERRKLPGVARAIRKPFDSEELVRTIEELLANGSKGGEGHGR